MFGRCLGDGLGPICWGVNQSVVQRPGRDEGDEPAVRRPKVIGGSGPHFRYSEV